MVLPKDMTPASLRLELSQKPKARARDLADQLGVADADLVASMVGVEATVIDATPDRLFPLLEALGQVMGLTRNDHVVNENVGVYANYHSGDHASMVLNGSIDLRIFPRHWVHGFAVERKTTDGVRRSIQVFDAAGDAIHKIFLRPESSSDAFDALVSTLKTDDQTNQLSLVTRTPPEAAKGDAAKADILRKEWKAMTDTHQFMRLTSKLKMNRLGAYRMVGAPFVTPLQPNAAQLLVEKLSEKSVPAMVFVGNQGCIQIQGGALKKYVEMGPWVNILDTGYNLHLRADRVAEVWLVEKPTRRGTAYSLEAFAADGGLITQIFGLRTKDIDHVPAFAEILKSLPVREEETV